MKDGNSNRDNNRDRKERQFEDNLTYLSSFINIIFEPTSLSC